MTPARMSCRQLRPFGRLYAVGKGQDGLGFRDVRMRILIGFELLKRTVTAKWAIAKSSNYPPFAHFWSDDCRFCTKIRRDNVCESSKYI